MNLISTRNSGESIPAIEAVLKGISRDGGLFVPEVFPVITLDMFTELGKMPYYKVAARVLSAFFGLTDENAEAIDVYKRQCSALACVIVGTNPLAIAAYGVASLAAGACRKMKRVGVCLGFLITQAFFIFYICYGELRSISLIAMALAAAAFLVTPRAVSYTHLDVYKRQAQPCCHPCRGIWR